MLTLIGVIVGGTLGFGGTYLTYCLNNEKSKRDSILKSLEEAYKLTKEYTIYTKGIVGYICAGKKDEKNHFVKIHFELVKILDYNLLTRESFVKELDELQAEVVNFILNQSPSFNPQCFEEKSNKLEKKILDWIKNEKIKIESEPTPFQGKYWMILIKNRWSSLKNSPKNFRNSE